jgi:large subunit ribosomal protein L19
MKRNAVLHKLEQKQIRDDRPQFHIGDTITVHSRIIEGDKERVQKFTGTVIARDGTGSSETFTMRRVAYGEGMERVFPLHSPRVAKIELLQEGDVRRAKLYDLRGKTGKKAKVRQRVVSRYASKKGAKVQADGNGQPVPKGSEVAVAPVDSVTLAVAAEAETVAAGDEQTS